MGGLQAGAGDGGRHVSNAGSDPPFSGDSRARQVVAHRLDGLSGRILPLDRAVMDTGFVQAIKHLPAWQAVKSDQISFMDLDIPLGVVVVETSCGLLSGSVSTEERIGLSCGKSATPYQCAQACQG